MSCNFSNEPPFTTRCWINIIDFRFNFLRRFSTLHSIFFSEVCALTVISYSLSSLFVFLFFASLPEKELKSIATEMLTNNKPSQSKCFNFDCFSVSTGPWRHWDTELVKWYGGKCNWNEYLRFDICQKKNGCCLDAGFDTQPKCIVTLFSRNSHVLDVIWSKINVISVEGISQNRIHYIFSPVLFSLFVVSAIILREQWWLRLKIWGRQRMEHLIILTWLKLFKTEETSFQCNSNLWHRLNLLKSEEKKFLHHTCSHTLCMCRVFPLCLRRR